MADAAVEFLLENVTQLLLNQAKLISNARGQVEQLEKDLRMFKAFLEGTTKKRRKDKGLREMVRRIQDVVYEAEDIIDAFVTLAAVSKTKNYFKRALQKPVELHSIARKVEGIRQDVDAILDKNRQDFATSNHGEGGPSESDTPEVPQSRKKNVVGFEDETNTLMGYLREPSEELDVISIIGMPGLGKTTVAGKIFHDTSIQYEFPTRIWIYVSQEFTVRDVFLRILGELMTNIPEHMNHKSNEEIARIVSSELERGKFLIVMDDVWTNAAWDQLQAAFPNGNTAGKILLTSRHEEVARHANHNRSPHKLRLMTQDESWLLLQYEVFGKPYCPPDLEDLGKLIATRCDGLPLAIVVIGGVLAGKFSPSGDPIERKNAWSKVSRSFSEYLKEDPQGRMEKIIALSYDKLPYHLRACFLYFAMFPEDYPIPVWKLIRMWIAEGFIQKKENLSLEETAEDYLDDLIKRNLVMVDAMKRDGKVKTCRIHDMLRDFCKTEAGNENFLQEIKKSNDGQYEPSQIGKSRRLCIHSNVLNFISGKRMGPHVRSFACFSKDETTLPTESVSDIPAAFKLLRVLDVKPIKFTKIPSDMYELLHLRYIHLSFDLKMLPKAFSKLWNIQTLIVDTNSRVLEINADIWKMTHFMHLKTNASATLPKPEKSSSKEISGKFQTLGTISPESCTKEVFDRVHYLKKLGIRGKLVALLEGKGGASFDNMAKLENLEKLKLINQVFPGACSDFPLGRLPPVYVFPKKLKSLTISDTHMEWEQMSVLGWLDKLEVLKLKNNAFKGEMWDTSDRGFPRLQVLYMERTNIVIWKASAQQFPKLIRVELRNCEELQEIPFKLAQVETFQVLDLYHANSAAASAKKIRDEKLKKHPAAETTTGGVGFKLYVFPPTNDHSS